MKNFFKKKKNIKNNSILKKKKKIKVTEFTTVSELASMMKKNPIKIIKICISLGIMATLNQRLDAETLILVSDELGYKVKFVGIDIEEATKNKKDKKKYLKTRPPVVTIMGHVNHGKTTLLNYIRKTKILPEEYGGITQHISAYNVILQKGKSITFLDTPGHEAFIAMRARGIKITDIVVIVIATDENILPQTKEAIIHAKSAKVPIIFALNKIDKLNSNPNIIKEQLSNMNILVEEWGGKYQSQEISSKLGTNIDCLLEKILLEAEILNLKANPNKEAVGTVIEAALDKGRGYVTTILVQGGTIKIGDYLLAGNFHGKIKNILNDRGKSIKSAGPSIPVTILGLNGAPLAGDKFKVFKSEKKAKILSYRRLQLQREQNVRSQKKLTLDEIGRRIKIGNFKELKIIIKADVTGSVEVLADSFQKLSNEKLIIKIIYKGVGQITESDVLLCNTLNAILIGFNVKPTKNAKIIAKKEKVKIRIYSIIYNAIDDLKKNIKKIFSFKEKKKEKILGSAKIKEVFIIPNLGTIAGCLVIKGNLIRNAKIKLIRKKKIIYKGVLNSLKVFKKDVKIVSKGQECGLGIKDFNNLKKKDIIEFYKKIF